ncbi:hypothetical protein F5X98DRAFT_370058 [Xylaria grammica]|nr:hypothetical protein F5X98DRAFT_370058 [Xylaria grammica]
MSRQTPSYRVFGIAGWNLALFALSIADLFKRYPGREDHIAPSFPFIYGEIRKQYSSLRSVDHGCFGGLPRATSFFIRIPGTSPKRYIASSLRNKLSRVREICTPCAAIMDQTLIIDEIS